MAVTRTDHDQTYAGGVLVSDTLVQRDVTTEANAATLRTQAGNALAANRTYLALAAPTNAQVAAQVRLLTQETTALVRLVLGALDGAD